MNETVKVRRRLLRQMTLNAVFAALLCVLAPISVAIGPIPVTLGWLGVFLAGVSLSPQNSIQAIAVYLALGAVGVPVFSGGAGGLQVFAGPTGGYLWSYLLVAPAIGLFRSLCPSALRKGVTKACRWGCYGWEIAACVLSMLIGYTCGTIQFCAITGNSVEAALGLCVWPFVPFDLLKVAAAVAIGRRMRVIMER